MKQLLMIFLFFCLHSAFLPIHVGLISPFKGAVCNNYADLLTEMEYNTYNYVVSSI